MKPTSIEEAFSSLINVIEFFGGTVSIRDSDGIPILSFDNESGTCKVSPERMLLFLNDYLCIKRLSMDGIISDDLIRHMITKCIQVHSCTVGEQLENYDEEVELR